MSLTDLAYRTFVSPVFWILEFIFRSILDATGTVGGALIGFGAAVPLLLSPLYRAVEQRSRDGEHQRTAMQDDVRRMKRNYRRKELYYYVRTIRRQHDYSPLRELFRSGDVLVQVFVFFLTYQFLRDHSLLQGVPFLWIADLGRPDRLATKVNILPLLMTILSITSAVLYARTRTHRVSASALAGVFLVLLYDSPSGLVLYWTSSNAYSVIRNIAARVRIVRHQDTRLKDILPP